MRLAAFGAGFFSGYHYESWSRIPGVTLVGICVAGNRARAEDVAARYGGCPVFTDPAAMLDAVTPDLLDIITTPESHLALVRLAAARGIPAICQKPLAPSLGEAEEMAATAERAGTLLVAHENWRFRPWFREIGRLVQDGAIGEPYNVTFRMRPGDGQGPRAYLDRQPYFQKMPRFLIHETGIHMIDVFRFLLGDIAGVGAHLRRLNPVIAGEDAGLVTFDFASGAAGLLDGNRLADHEADNTRLTMGELVIEGSEGALRLDGFARIFRRRRGGREQEHGYAWENRGYAGDSVHALQSHVVDHLRDGSPVENTAAEYLRAMDVEAAVYRAHAERRWVEVPVRPAAG
jgi:predicted dehydrogenase